MADALIDKLGNPPAIVCPAFPEVGRTVYQGHLFVFNDPLDESSMRHHPITPMTDSSLLRLMSAQSKKKVGLIPWQVVSKGADAVREEIAVLQQQGFSYLVVDALENRDLYTIGEACADTLLVTEGSGIAMGLPDNFRRSGMISNNREETAIPFVAGPTVILSGSCSVSTCQQVGAAKGDYPSFKLDPLALDEDEEESLSRLSEVVLRKLSTGPVLVYAGADSDEVCLVQERIGRERALKLLEQAFGKLAVLLRSQGVTRFVDAGGETADAVVSALNVEGLRIGPQIDPGVPWTVSIGKKKVAIVLKSGNFGTRNFFTKAIGMLSGGERSALR